MADWDFKTADQSAANWQPGGWGKGFMDLDGMPHTWPINGPAMGNDPSHEDMATQMFGDPEAYNTPIVIHPSGQYTGNPQWGIPDEEREEARSNAAQFRYLHPDLKYIADPMKWELRTRNSKTADLLGPSAYPAEQPQMSEDEDMAVQPFPMLDAWGQPVLPPNAQQLYYQEQGPNVQISTVSFKGAKRIKVAGKIAYVSKAVPGLQDWARDNGFKLAEYPGGGNMLDHMRVREDNELYNNGDPQFQPERALQDKEPVSYKCPRCGEGLPDFGQFSLHMDEHDGRPEDDVQDGHFPGLPLGDEPLGFGTNPKGTAGDTIAHVAGWSAEPDTMYHIAPSHLRPAIQQQGLVPDEDESVFMSETPGQGYLNSQPGQMDVWKINTQGLPIQSGKPLSWEVPEFTHDGPIPLNRLELVHRGDPMYDRYMREYLPMDMVNGQWQEVSHPAYANGEWLRDPRTASIDVWAKGSDPKDMIEAPVPFVYDIPSDKLHIGYEGTTTHDVTTRVIKEERVDHVYDLPEHATEGETRHVGGAVYVWHDN